MVVDAFFSLLESRLISVSDETLCIRALCKTFQAQNFVNMCARFVCASFPCSILLYSLDVCKMRVCGRARG